MLVLTRNPGEAIIINDNIKIYYLGLNPRGGCKLGIEAPEEIKVNRQEVQDKINYKNQNSTK